MLTYALTYADVSGGADGSLRVWARGSVAGGGPFPSSDKPLTHPDASSASASGCPPLHSFSESEDKRFSQELQRGSGGEAGGGAGAAVTNEEAMQRLLEASGGSAISAASFFATPEPGHDPRHGRGSPHDMLRPQFAPSSRHPFASSVANSREFAAAQTPEPQGGTNWNLELSRGRRELGGFVNLESGSKPDTGQSTNRFADVC